MYEQDDLRFNISTVNANLAHTCGNASSLVFNMFKKFFPKDFFKSEHVNTRLAIRQFQDIRRTIDFKKQKPIVAMQPRVQVDLSEFNIDMWHRLYGTSIYDLVRPGYYDVKFFKDEQKGIIVDFAVERLKMSFEYTVVVSTEFQQYNVLAHMKNNIRIEHPFYEEGVTLETVLPECIVSQISKDSGIPVKDENGSVKPFLDYMNKISNIPITYGLQTSTGVDRFFMVVTTNLWLNFNGLSMSDGDRDGQTSDYFPIQLQLDTEFNYPSVFYYLNKNTTSEDAPAIDNTDSTTDETMIMNGKIDMHFTMQKDIIPQYDDNRNEIYLSCTFDVDVDENEDKEDRTDISSLFLKEQTDLINEMLTQDKDPSEYMNIVVYINSDILDKDMYEIDWVTKELVIKHPSNLYTYRLACYTNKSIMNDYILRHHVYK